MMDKEARIFVAGHRGLVGSAVVRRLERDGYHHLITRTHTELNLTRQQDVEAFFEQERPEYVFLCAAKVGGIMANNTYPAQFIYENIMIATNIIHAGYIFGVKKLLNLGSSCIYPRLAPQPLKEEYLLGGELEPTNEAYAIAKIAAIKLCRYYNQQYGTNFLSVMPTNLYGPHDNFDLASSHVLPALIRKLHLGKCLQQNDWMALRADLSRNPIGGINDATSQEEILKILSHNGIEMIPSNQVSMPISSHGLPGARQEPFSTCITLWGTGRPLREFLHVDDLAEACIHLMQYYDAQQIGEFVNIGTGRDQTIADLARLTAAVVGYTGGIRWDASRPDGTPQKLLDVSRMNSLGWQASIGLQEGIESTYGWYLEQ